MERELQSGWWERDEELYGEWRETEGDGPESCRDNGGRTAERVGESGGRVVGEWRERELQESSGVAFPLTLEEEDQDFREIYKHQPYLCYGSKSWESKWAEN